MAVVAEEIDLTALCVEYATAKKAENAAAAKAKALREKILKMVPEDPDHETTEIPGGIKVVYKNKGYFDDEIVAYLEEHGYAEAITKKVNTDRLSSLIDVGLLTTENVAQFYVEKWETSLTVTRG